MATVSPSAVSPNQVAICVSIPCRALHLEDAGFRIAAIAIRDVILASYHASPWGVATVLSETEELVARFATEERMLLAGDLNSLAASDFPPQKRELRSFASIADRYRLAGAVSFAVLDRLLAAGYRDELPADGAGTVPTAIPRPCDHGLPHRLDYCLSRGLRAVTRVLRDPPFSALSDHYPLACSL